MTFLRRALERLQLARFLPNLQPASLVWLLVLGLALRAAAAAPLQYLNHYDEALLFTDAFSMSKGEVPYRDFYSNYPPGSFQLIRAVMALGVPVIWGTRMLALFVRLGAVALAATLAGAGRGYVCLGTLITGLVFQLRLGPSLYAYLVAVALALLTIAVWPEPGAPRHKFAICGACFGTISYFRHDLFVYAGLGLLTLEVAWWLWRKQSLFTGSLRELGYIVAGALGSVLVLWTPVFVRAGFARPLHDLVLDQARLVMPGRVLPFPLLTTWESLPSLKIKLPAWLAQDVVAYLVFALIALAAVTVLALTRLAREHRVEPGTRVLLLLLVFALATLPQALGRTDAVHLAFGAPLVVASLFRAFGTRITTPVLVLAVLPWFARTPDFIDWQRAKLLWHPREDRAFLERARVAAVDLIRRETSEQDRIYVGCASHRRTMDNYLDIYYMAGRLGATRYMQFDPGTVTGEQGQREMIADLQRTRPPIALLHPKCAWDEANASRVPGATLLDTYLRTHYHRSGSVSGLELWRRGAL